MKICPALRYIFMQKANSFSHQAFSTRTVLRLRHNVTCKWSISHPTMLRRLTDRVSDNFIILRYFICVHGLKKRPCHLVALRETNEHIVNEAYATTMITTDQSGDIKVPDTFFKVRAMRNSKGSIITAPVKIIRIFLLTCWVM